jgi:glyoxylate carboligase
MDAVLLLIMKEVEQIKHGFLVDWVVEKVIREKLVNLDILVKQEKLNDMEMIAMNIVNAQLIAEKEVAVVMIVVIERIGAIEMVEVIDIVKEMEVVIAIVIVMTEDDVIKLLFCYILIYVLWYLYLVGSFFFVY